MKSEHVVIFINFIGWDIAINNITKQTNYYYTLEQVGYYFADPGTGEYSIGRIIWPDW